MDKIIIEGGAVLHGSVQASGSKNACLPIMAATLLCPGVHHVSRVPRLRDVTTMGELFEQLGVRMQRNGDGLTIYTGDMEGWVAPYDVVRKMRASILVLGALMGRFGKAKVSLPGGCAIGTRPVDEHLRALKAMGATIELTDGYIHAEAPNGLKGADVHLSVATVTGTENILMAAATADGVTRISNAAREPEVVDLADALRNMGADIEGDGSETITIRGVQELRPMRHRVIADRIEVGTYLVAGAITRGDVTVTDCTPSHLTNALEKLEAIGVTVDVGEDWVRARVNGPLRGVNLTTEVYPGFPTDLQAQFMVLLCLVDQGASQVEEHIFENRFMHVAELRRMGANINEQGRAAHIEPVSELRAAPIMATDLRASAGLVLAGLTAKGSSEVRRVYHIDRGYEEIEGKLRSLGASIRREKE